ncbi:MAG: hypothetical protein ACRDLP_16455, partial [Solirubrobacteraceae bacterium]
MPRASSIGGMDWGGLALLAVIVALIGLSILFGRRNAPSSQPPEEDRGDGGARRRPPRPRPPRGDHA